MSARSFLSRLAAGRCIAAALLALAASTAAASGPGAAALRWNAALAEFARADQERPPPEGGVLFVGSSSIRLWPRMTQDFTDVPVLIQRGFGGSTMADCHELVRELVIRYRPRQVVVYAGENDLMQGRSPVDVLNSFRGFTQVLRSELPQVRIAYISIKPSPYNGALLGKVRETNRLLAAYLGTLAQASFVDVFTPMLDAGGAPRPELFGPDRLHMNEQGYAVWRSALRQVLPSAAAVAAAELSDR